jgi:hypothetical protein
MHLLGHAKPLEPRQSGQPIAIIARMKGGQAGGRMDRGLDLADHAQAQRGSPVSSSSPLSSAKYWAVVTWACPSRCRVAGRRACRNNTSGRTPICLTARQNAVGTLHRST